MIIRFNILPVNIWTIHIQTRKKKLVHDGWKMLSGSAKSSPCTLPKWAISQVTVSGSILISVSPWPLHIPSESLYCRKHPPISSKALNPKRNKLKPQVHSNISSFQVRLKIVETNKRSTIFLPWGKAHDDHVESRNLCKVLNVFNSQIHIFTATCKKP